jgi:hypothetical protein
MKTRAFSRPLSIKTDAFSYRFACKSPEFRRDREATRQEYPPLLFDRKMARELDKDQFF